jgi:hypothetical protein
MTTRVALVTKRSCLNMGQHVLGYGVLAYLVWKYWAGLAHAASYGAVRVARRVHEGLVLQEMRSA